MTFSLFSDIPHFKEVVIMATVCDYCGHKTNEVKSGGGIESKGKRISLKVTDVSDMSRDVLKVSTAANSFFYRQWVKLTQPKLGCYYFTGKISPLKCGILPHWLTRKGIREKKGCLYTKIPGSWFIIPTPWIPLWLYHISIVKDLVKDY